MESNNINNIKILIPNQFNNLVKKLKIEKECSISDVERAFRKFSLKEHPNKKPSEDKNSATAFFQKISGERNILIKYLSNQISKKSSTLPSFEPHSNKSASSSKPFSYPPPPPYTSAYASKPSSKPNNNLTFLQKKIVFKGFVSKSNNEDFKSNILNKIH